ncbi:MAG TPA: hypothetical protein PKX47_10645, partial [Smithellaceae bacterium]|nr:hypothetical protein [Smithellaceae bacterium]
ESFEKCHFEERERREILRMAVCSRFLPSVEMTKMAVIQSSHSFPRCPPVFHHPVVFSAKPLNVSPAKGCAGTRVPESNIIKYLLRVPAPGPA